MSIEIIGYTAIGISTFASIPQLIQIIKTKRVRDLNPYFFTLDCIACIMYIIYGILDKNYIIMSSSIMPFINRLIIIILYYNYKNHNNDES
jgi:MtN3 and saliva related transmembrane protein